MERGEEREGKEEEEEEETFSPGREETDPNEHFPSDIFFKESSLLQYPRNDQDSPCH